MVEVESIKEQVHLLKEYIDLELAIIAGKYFIGEKHTLIGTV